MWDVTGDQKTGRFWILFTKMTLGEGPKMLSRDHVKITSFECFFVTTYNGMPEPKKQSRKNGCEIAINRFVLDNSRKTQKQNLTAK